MTLCRSGLHEIRGPHDKRGNGQCAVCSRRNEAAYRQRQRDRNSEGREIMSALESMTADELVERINAVMAAS